MAEGTTALGQKDDAKSVDPEASASSIALLKGSIDLLNSTVTNLETAIARLDRADHMAIGMGLVTGWRRAVGLGHNSDVDAAEDVWPGGGDYPWMTGATALEVLSDNAADAAVGTGARTVLVSGLDAAWAEVSQVITLNGTTPVAIPTSLYRIQSALIMSAGSGKVNAGTIAVRDVGGGTTRAIIDAGYGITRQSQFTVPAGMALSVNSMFFSVNRATPTPVATFATFVQSPNGFYRLPLEIGVDGNPYRHDGLPGIVLPEKTDFGLRCTSISAANSDVTAAWLGILKTL